MPVVMVSYHVDLGFHAALTTQKFVGVDAACCGRSPPPIFCAPFDFDLESFVVLAEETRTSRPNELNGVIPYLGLLNLWFDASPKVK